MRAVINGAGDGFLAVTGMAKGCDRDDAAAVTNPSQFFIAIYPIQFGSGTQETTFSPGDVAFCMSDRSIGHKTCAAQMAVLADVGGHVADLLSIRAERRTDLTHL